MSKKSKKRALSLFISALTKESNRIYREVKREGKKTGCWLVVPVKPNNKGD